MIIVLIAVFLLLTYRHAKLKKKSHATKEKHADEEKMVKKEFNQRQKDIMKTLNDNENMIIRSLFEQEAPLTQSQVRYTTNIPKTSLHRYLSKLQQKEIIKVTEYGKLRKLELTEFFLR